MDLFGLENMFDLMKKIASEKVGNVFKTSTIFK